MLCNFKNNTHTYIAIVVDGDLHYFYQCYKKIHESV